MSKKPAHHEAHANREQLMTERERLRVEQAQTVDLATDDARERGKRLTEIDAEIAKLDEEESGDGDEDKDV